MRNWFWCTFWFLLHDFTSFAHMLWCILFASDFFIRLIPLVLVFFFLIPPKHSHSHRRSSIRLLLCLCNKFMVKPLLIYDKWMVWNAEDVLLQSINTFLLFFFFVSSIKSAIIYGFFILKFHFQRFFFSFSLFRNRYYSKCIDWYRNQRVSVESYRHFVGLREIAKWSRWTYLGIPSSGRDEELAGFGLTRCGSAIATIDPGLCQNHEISSSYW